MDKLEGLKFDERGLIPAIVQDVDTKGVLMLAYMNEDSLRKTLDTGKPGFGAVVERNCGIKGNIGAYPEGKEYKL